MKNIGDMFQKETFYERDKLRGRTLDWDKKPSIYKEYASSKIIELPPVQPLGEMSISEALMRRRSVRDYRNETLDKERFSFLLWSTSGLQRAESGHAFRTAPSAGALYPVETYICCNNVEGIEEGIYHYNVKSHALSLLSEGDMKRKVTTAALGQEMCSSANFISIWTGIFMRSKWKYDQRAYRYIYLDAGHMAQNLYLAAVSVGLGVCGIGALFDEEINEILGVDGVQESVIYMASAGIPE